MKKMIALSIISSMVLVANSTIQSPIVIGEKSSKILSIYNKGIGHIQEKETIELLKGTTEALYKNVPAAIITDSLNVKSNDIHILTQHYFHNTPNITNIAKYNIGNEVTYYNKLIDDKQYRKGKFIAINNNTGLIEDNGIISIPLDNIVFKTLPTNMHINPFLSWNIAPIKETKKENIELNYLTRGLQWKSEYTVLLDETNKKMDLSGWFNIKNSSGIDFEDMTVKVIAGEVNSIDDKPQPRAMMAKTMAMDNVAGTMEREIKPEDVSGLKVYALPFKTTLMNNQDTQINFINEMIDYKKYNQFYSYADNIQKNEKPNQVLSFVNTTKKALPQGNIRFYSKEIFVGSNTIGDLSDGMEQTLIIGKNFDIYLNDEIKDKKEFKNANKDGYFCKYNRIIDKKYEVVNNQKNKEEIRINLNIPSKDNNKLKIDNPKVKIVNTKDFMYELIINMEEKSKIEFNVNFDLCNI